MKNNSQQSVNTTVTTCKTLGTPADSGSRLSSIVAVLVVALTVDAVDCGAVCPESGQLETGGYSLSVSGPGNDIARRAKDAKKHFCQSVDGRFFLHRPYMHSSKD